MSPVPIYCLPKVPSTPPNPAWGGGHDPHAPGEAGEQLPEVFHHLFNLVALEQQWSEKWLFLGSALVDNYLQVAAECREGGRRSSCVSEAAEVGTQP